MKKLTIASLTAAAVLLSLHSTRAGSATWNTSPTSGDWNTAANWTPATIPNGPSDIATFGSSSQTSLSLSAATEVSQIVFNSGASAFTITPKLSTQVNVLTISGAGITNSSGITQNLATNANGFKTGEIHFTNTASAGTDTFITNHGNSVSGLGAYTQFFNNATAGSATIVNEGGESGITSATIFNDTSNAGGATLITTIDPTGVPGDVTFRDSSSAANGTFIGNGGFFTFEDTSSAGSGVFTLGGPDAGTTTPTVIFYPETTAANSIFTVKGGQGSGFIGGLIFFDGNSDHVTATVEAGAVSGALGGTIQFDGGTAANGTFTLNGASISGAAGAATAFTSQAAGGNAVFNLGGGTVSGAGGATMICSQMHSNVVANLQNATVIVNGGTNGGSGGDLEFRDNSSGGAARIKVSGNARVDVSNRSDHPFITVGSIEGNGALFLGGSVLEIGGNNLNTTFSGVIQDGGVGGGVGGSVIKAGTGRLIFTKGSSYTGTTTVEGGTLLANNRAGSATGTGSVQLNAGTFGGAGIVAGAVTLGTGGGAGAFLAPGKSGVKPGTLTIQAALTMKADATYKVTLDSRNTTADTVSASGISVQNASILFNDLGTSVLSAGTSFTVINNTAATPISGVFNNLADGATVSVGSNIFKANYKGGNGNDLTLTVQ
jgi:autotransporter-associated beta strand protein